MAIDQIKEGFGKEKKIAEEIASLSDELLNSTSDEERGVIASQINLLKESLKKAGGQVIDSTERVSMAKPLGQSGQPQERPPMQKQPPPKQNPFQIKTQLQIDAGVFSSDLARKTEELEEKGIRPGAPGWPGADETIKEAQMLKSKVHGPRQKPMPLEKLTLKRMKRKEGVKVVKKKEKKASTYVKIASSMFANRATKLIKKGRFHSLERDLIRANMEFVPVNYISVIYFTTLISFFAGIFLTIFFLFFSLVVSPPFIVPAAEGIGARIVSVFWIMFALPALIYLFVYFYPSMERKSIETRINLELPFATIHMSSISSSMLEPSKIFSIIIRTGEYPFLEKEFTRLLNEVNVYGYDLVSALRDRAFNSPSRKLSDLYNGLATTINSGGDLPEFFAKRSETLLFEHGIETEKHSKAAETFMDIYISVVITAPMILMLLLVMMSASGLGLSLSTGMITLIMVLAVLLMNVLFLAFLHLKQPGGE